MRGRPQDWTTIDHSLVHPRPVPEVWLGSRKKAGRASSMSNKTAGAVDSSGHLARPRVVPAALGGQQPINFRRPPGALVILMERGCVPKRRVHDTPGSLNRVLAREERGIAVDGVAQESLIRPHLVRRLVV